MEDRELVQRLLAKDEEAFRDFHRLYHDRIYRAASFLLGFQDPDAEDIAQDVFVAALQQLPQFQFRSSLYHWLNRICMYLCFERIRKRKRQVATLEGDLEAIAQPLSAARGDRESEDKERERLLGIMRTQRSLLGKPCQALLDLREVERKSYAQIAEKLRIPIGTVMSRLSRCKEALKDLVLGALKEKTHDG